MNKFDFVIEDEYENIVEYGVKAYYSGCGGLGIIEINDYVIYIDNFFGGKNKKHKTKIYYNTKRPYFNYWGVRIHLDECIRCES